MRSSCSILAISALLLAPFALQGAEPGTATVAEEMRRAAEAWLASLEPDQKEQALFPFDAERKDWHYFPKQRDAISLKEMDDEQKALAFDLIAAGLSAQGLDTVKDVISLEEVLRAMERGGRAFSRDPELYHLWIFGKPGAEIWGWRFEGHHLSLNATVVPGVGVSMTPSFFGANPAKVLEGPRKGLRALPDEEDLGFALVESFSAAQREQAVFATNSPGEIYSFVDRKTKPLPVEGIPFSDLNEEQQALLQRLISVYLERNRPEIAMEAMAVIESDGWEEVRFGWAGSLTRGAGHYYYAQGPSFLIEYDNSQNAGNHIHSVWREFDGDFGEDLIGRHRRAHAH